MLKQAVLSTTIQKGSATSLSVRFEVPQIYGFCKNHLEACLRAAGKYLLLQFSKSKESLPGSSGYTSALQLRRCAGCLEGKKKKKNRKTLAFCTGSLGWLVLVEVGRTASWPEHPSDCPVLTPPAPPYLEPTAPASQKQSREPVPWGYSCILTPLQATRLGRAAGSRTATCSSQSSRLQACSREDELVRPCSEDL